ncbi:hypothetical protein [Caballeronia insecticola]|uniref:Lysine-specific metallo-endopeptidase domain-containing protein n=1 Tax=Caballeronia insecticola TaxID=758793 RepID=R4WRU8_9BURK|nr:hypothetical protein [Caballeronia insecticola]BAN23665.1 putative uncharacterized protein [Caballeronia insecticola]
MKFVQIAALSILIILLSSTAHSASITAVPSNLSFDKNYYKKYIDASGIPIVAAAEVDDQAILKMQYIVNTMMKKDASTRQAMVRNVKGVLIIPKSKGMTTLPEYVNLDKTNPILGSTWNERAQGVGWTPALPYVSCSEANLMHAGYPLDRYPDESICIHEFAHTVFDAGIVYRDSGASSRLSSLFAAAKANGYQQDSYAASDRNEYWAESVQAWFNAATCSNRATTTVCTINQLYDTDRNLWNEIGHWFFAPYELTQAMYP